MKGSTLHILSLPLEEVNSLLNASIQIGVGFLVSLSSSKVTSEFKLTVYALRMSLIRIDAYVLNFFLR